MYGLFLRRAFQSISLDEGVRSLSKTDEESSTLFRIGNWHWRTGIAALAEIAAGAFAQSLLDLPCHPKILDFVAVDALSDCNITARTRPGTPR
jgi:hypothetical protein